MNLLKVQKNKNQQQSKKQFTPYFLFSPNPHLKKNVKFKKTKKTLKEATKMNPTQQKREEYAIVLDYLPYGKSGEATKEPIAQVIGDTNFTLLEVVARPGVQLNAGQKVYIGKEHRAEIDHIKKRVKYDELTTSAQKELEKELPVIVQARENEFINFINRAGPINIRSHVLELLPAIGKKHLVAILDIRDKKPFASFKDFQERVPHVQNILQILTERILLEIKGNEKYYLFVKQPRPEEERRPLRRY